MKRKRNIFFTSDTHFFHANSIKFDKRPFTSVDNMHKGLIKRWNSVVKPNDYVYHLGDLGMPKGPYAAKQMQNIISQLNGRKIILRGNHDKGHTTLQYYGFDIAFQYMAMEIAGEIVTICHYPLRGTFREDVTGMRNTDPDDNWHGESRHFEKAVPDNGQFHLHGHTHCGPANGKPVKTDRQWDVGVPGNNYIPVSISQVESWIVKVKKKEGRE